MKLSEYIFKEYNKSVSALSADDIEKWIVEWYISEFKEVDCGAGSESTPRQPPMWLANWRKVDELE